MTPPDEPTSGPRPGRRDVLKFGAGAALGAAAVGTGWAVSSQDGDESAKEEPAAPTTPPPPPTQRFVSTQLTAPQTTVWRKDGATTSAGLLLTTPRSPAFRAVIYDDDGSPVWIEPDGNAATDLRVQTYRGRPVLTYWTGEIKQGTGNGKGVILDESYQLVAEVRCGNGVLSDLHEFQLTSRGTALLTSYPTLPLDLTPIGGPADGYVWGARVQEVDVETGEVLLDWEGLDHIDLEETYDEIEDTGSPEAPFDPIHINSVAEDGDGLLLCCRHTGALYKIDRVTGELRWRMGGKRSDFEVPEEASFGWQHDLRRQPDGTLTIYDNHDRKEETESVSAALRLEVDETAMTVRLVQALRHEDRYGYAMGNAHYLDDGHVLVGWGMDPYATEFDESGEVVFELGGLGLGSYRSYRSPWRGRPTTVPDLALGPDGSAHASWNGATDVVSWRFLAGSSANGLAEVATVPRAGFETSAPLSGERFVRAEALDGRGRVLGTSRVVGS
ncbi:arylsulfotransferase family protein [Nocardioides piscis]|uniref:ArsR family transcriptional regulator n=1 Tax=Nocardioides piscis TaxID=2714938 RepID=A0A6G7YFQ2_9ACTN|nr:arylsulfotransferase family protein [Nocardioides piscis]QIK75468.1 ArsR family transcriptional regulator [Nocardioides piscis]